MNVNFVSLKQRLKEDKPLFGTFVKLPRPEVVEVLALAGLDFIICDLEHSQMDEDGARAVILTGRWGCRSLSGFRISSAALSTGSLKRGLADSRFPAFGIGRMLSGFGSWFFTRLRVPAVSA